MEDREKEIRDTINSKAKWAMEAEWNDGWRACVYLLSLIDEAREGNDIERRALIDAQERVHQLEAVADAVVKWYEWTGKANVPICITDTLRAAGKIKE